MLPEVDLNMPKAETGTIQSEMLMQQHYLKVVVGTSRELSKRTTRRKLYRYAYELLGDPDLRAEGLLSIAASSLHVVHDRRDQQRERLQVLWPSGDSRAIWAEAQLVAEDIIRNAHFISSGFLFNGLTLVRTLERGGPYQEQLPETRIGLSDLHERYAAELSSRDDEYAAAVRVAHLSTN